MSREPLAALVLAAGLLLLPRAVQAHRLDEYLQATRLAVGATDIAVEVNLTPGAQIADAILSVMDSDRDGRIDAREADAYASRIATDLDLVVDGRAYPLTFTPRDFPESSAMRAGTGVIRLSASVAIASARGHHRISFVNRHMTDVSVYLVNALVPANPSIVITALERDRLQRHLAVDYTVSGSNQRAAWSLAAAGLVGVVVAVRFARFPWKTDKAA